MGNMAIKKHSDVDKQHGKVFLKIKKLSITIKKMGSEREVFHKLFSLARYAEKHFTEEEELMFMSGYRPYSAHKQRHREFIRKIGEIKTAYHSNNTSPVLPGYVQSSLGEWLAKHIEDEDAALLAWLNDKTRKNRFIMRDEG